jgi:hypothetical protein
VSRDAARWSAPAGGVGTVRDHKILDAIEPS